MMKRIFVLLLALAPAWGFAAGGGVHLDKANIDPTNKESLQRGARLFVNYCLSCHAAALMRSSSRPAASSSVWRDNVPRSTSNSARRLATRDRSCS